MSTVQKDTPHTGSVPDFSTNVNDDNFAFANIPLLFNSPIVETHIKTKDVNDTKTKLYVQTQVYNRFEYSVNNAKNLFGTLLAAGVLVWGVASLISKDDEDTSASIADGAETVAGVSAIAFSTAHLLNAVVANVSGKEDESKYKPEKVPNPYSSKN